jgi:hypothetical protein
MIKRKGLTENVRLRFERVSTGQLRISADVPLTRTWDVAISVETSELFDQADLGAGGGGREARLSMALDRVPSAARAQVEAEVVTLGKAVGEASDYARQLTVVARVEGLFRWIPDRILPQRVIDEVIGDAIERLTKLECDGGPRWRMYLLWASVLLVIVSECVRYLARSLKGERA